METSEYYAIFRLESGYWWYRGLHELIVRFLGKLAGAHALRMFDAGCGTGRLMELMRPYGRVEGADVSPDAVALAKSRGLAGVSLQDLHAWNPAAAAYDLITCIDVLYHLEDDGAALAAFAKALKKNGALVVNAPAFEFLRRRHDLVVHTKRRYTVRGLKRKLERAGFAVERATYRLPWLAVIMLFIKAAEWFANPGAVESDLRPLPNALNLALLALHRLENFLIRSGLSLPFGSSVFVIARKL